MDGYSLLTGDGGRLFSLYRFGVDFFLVDVCSCHCTSFPPKPIFVPHSIAAMTGVFLLFLRTPLRVFICQSMCGTYTVRTFNLAGLLVFRLYHRFLHQYQYTHPCWQSSSATVDGALFSQFFLHSFFCFVLRLFSSFTVVPPFTAFTEDDFCLTQRALPLSHVHEKSQISDREEKNKTSQFTTSGKKSTTPFS